MHRAEKHHKAIAMSHERHQMDQKENTFKYKGKYDRAKSLFWEYKGRPPMYRSERGDDVLYDSFNISRTEEQAWAIELLNECFDIIKNLNNDKGELSAFHACFKLTREYKLEAELSEMLEYFRTRRDDMQQFMCLLASEYCVRFLKDKEFISHTNNLVDTAALLLEAAKKKEYKFPNGITQGLPQEWFSESEVLSSYKSYHIAGVNAPCARSAMSFN